jgi:polysaccharide biosynthesis transport protein
MELSEYLDILRRRWLSVLIIALTTLALASAVTLVMPKKYTATTQLFIVVAAESVTDLAQGSNFTEKQMSSYAAVATSPRVLTPVIDQLGLRTTPKELAESVEATAQAGKVILEIAATDPDPTQAAQLAKAVGDELAQAAGDFVTAERGWHQSVHAKTIAEAEVPDEPSFPNVPLNLGVALILGLLLGLGVAVLRHVLDTRVRNE